MRLAQVLGPSALILVMAVPAAVADNPVEGTVPVHFWYDGGHRVVFPRWNVRYDPDLPNYDACETEAGNPFNHMHPPDGFTAPDTIMYGEVTVTREMVNDYYDDHYYFVNDEEEPKWHRQSGSQPTCAQNCHGYATNKGVVIISSDDGMLVVLQDEYQEVEDKQEATIASAYDSHSSKVAFYSGCNVDPDLLGELRYRSEKSDASAVYYINYYPDAGPSGSWPGALYRPDDD